MVIRKETDAIIELITYEARHLSNSGPRTVVNTEMEPEFELMLDEMVNLRDSDDEIAEAMAAHNKALADLARTGGRFQDGQGYTLWIGGSREAKNGVQQTVKRLLDLGVPCRTVIGL